MTRPADKQDRTTRDRLPGGLGGAALRAGAAAGLRVGASDDYRVLFETSPLPMWVADQETPVFLAVNRAAALHYGDLLQEFLETGLGDLLAPAGRRRGSDLGSILRDAGGGGAWEGEWRHRRHDGSIVEAAIACAPVIFQGRRALLTIVVPNEPGGPRGASAREAPRGLEEQIAFERQEIARELHDEIGQLLAGLKILLERSGGAGAEEREAGRAEMIRIVRELMDRVRELTLDLKPPDLEESGLVPALLRHFRRYTDRTGVRVEFASRGAGRRLPSAVELGAFRVVQEALTNVALHAGVKEVAVRLRQAPAALTLEITDHGTGFDLRGSLTGGAGGLSGMRERARRLGASLRIASAPGRGTRVHARFPLAGGSSA